jgi:hypothetical protein
MAVVPGQVQLPDALQLVKVFDYGFFGVLYSTSLWNGFQTVS